MKKLILLLSLLATLNVYGQTSLTRDYTKAIKIDSSEGCNFKEYSYNNSYTSDDIYIEDQRLMTSEESSYFSFIVPTTGDAIVKIKFDNNENFGLALYKKENSNEYSFIKYDAFIDTNEGQISIFAFQELAGSEILCRFWKLEKSDQGQIFICVNSEEMPTVKHRNNKSLNISTGFTPAQLVDKLITGCLEYSNVQFTGENTTAQSAIGYFTNGTPSGTNPVIGISDGVIISTGDVKNAKGPNNRGDAFTIFGTPGNSLLSVLAGGRPTFDAAVLKFDFTPSSDSIQFEYVFASEEYPEYAPPKNSSYNDIFAFVISGGSENYVNQNIAIVPSTSNTPVSIANINPVTNTSLYVNNDGGKNTQFDGFTKLLTAKCPVTACDTYTIQLMIADVADGKYDSAVFLKSDSFTSGEAFTTEVQNKWGNNMNVYRGCSNFFRFGRMVNSDYDTPIEVKYTRSGDAIEGVDYTPIPESAIIDIDTDYVEINFDAIDNGEAPDSEPVKLILNFTSGCPCNPETSELVVTIYPSPNPNPSFTNSGPICIGEEATLNLGLDFPHPDMVIATWETGEIDVSSITVSPTTTTEYYVDLEYPCGTKRITNIVEVVPMPVVNLGADFDVDGGLNTTLTASLAPGNTGVWTVFPNPAGLIIQNPTSPTTSVTVPESGEYQFTWSETSLAPNCIASDDIKVTFLPAPTTEFEATTPDCFADNITVTFTGETSSTNPIFNWNFGTATVISGTGAGPYEIHFPTAGDHNISLTVTEYGLSNSNNVIVKVPHQIEGELITSDIKCFGSCNGSARINTSGGTAPYTYSWESENYELIDLCKGSYNLTVTDSKGCSFNKDFDINEPEKLTIDHNISNLNCHNDMSGQISVTVNGGVSPYSFAWSDGGANAPVRTNLSAGNYSLIVSDKNNCNISSEFVITEPEAFKISSNGNFSLCEGEKVDIIITSSGGSSPIQYYWSKNEAAFNLGQSSLSEIPTQSASYTIYAKDERNCISNQIFSRVQVSPKITLDINVEDILCKGECVGKANLNISGGLQPFNFSWNSNTPIITDLCAGNYNVVVTDNFNCSENIDFTIKEPDTKIKLETIITNAKCSYSDDGTAKIYASGGTTPYQYQWSTNSTMDEITGASGTYYASVTDANNCIETISAKISAPKKLEAIPLTDKTICLNGSTTVSAQAMGGTSPYSFQWTGEDGSIYPTREFTADPTVTTSYELTITDKNNCVTTGQKVKVNVNPPLSLSKFVSNFPAVCLGGKVLIDAYINGGDGGPYQITTQNGEIISLPYAYYPEESGNFTITVKDQCETPEVSQSIFVEVLPSPEINFYSDIQEACPNSAIKFVPSTNSKEIQSCYWAFGNHGFSEDPEPTYTFTSDGTYDVSLTLTDINGCTSTIKKPKYITIHKNPESIFIANPEYTGIRNPIIDFINQSIGAIYYKWNFGDNNSVINIKNPRHIYSNIGEYEVSLISENSFGCKDSTMRKIEIRDQISLFAPSAFTPNGDGINDCFRVCGSGIKAETFNLSIYNRWGERIFFTDKYFHEADCSSCTIGAWDGTGKSKSNSNTLLPTGIYSWHVTFKDFNNVYHEYNGTVNLIR